MPQVLEQVMAWQKFPIYFLWSVILCSTCTDKLYAVLDGDVACEQEMGDSLDSQTMVIKKVIMV